MCIHTSIFVCNIIYNIYVLKCHLLAVIITSGKDFIKITSVGMGAAKVLKQDKNGCNALNFVNLPLIHA